MKVENEIKKYKERKKKKKKNEWGSGVANGSCPGTERKKNAYDLEGHAEDFQRV